MTTWPPWAIAGGLIHFAHVVSPESLAARSAKSMLLGLGGQLSMHMFDNIEDVQE